MRTHTQPGARKFTPLGPQEKRTARTPHKVRAALIFPRPASGGVLLEVSGQAVLVRRHVDSKVRLAVCSAHRHVSAPRAQAHENDLPPTLADLDQ